VLEQYPQLLTVQLTQAFRLKSKYAPEKQLESTQLPLLSTAGDWQLVQLFLDEHTKQGETHCRQRLEAESM
jgi:hypothetical protein